MAETTDKEPCEETETLFQCKLCDYMGRSKGDIADHFISTHASIEVIESPIKSKSGVKGRLATPVKSESTAAATTTTTCSTDDDDDGGGQIAEIPLLAEDDESTSIGDVQNSPSRARPQRKRRAPKWLEEEEVELPTPKKSKEKDTAKGDVKNEENDEQEVEEEEEEVEDDKEEEEDYEEEGDVDDATAGDAVQDDHQDTVNSGQEEDEPNNKAEAWRKILEQQSIPITYEEFEAQVDKAFSEWETEWTKKNKLEETLCAKPGCGASIPEREVELHTSCHMRDYQGFECIYCDERFSHWNKMRKHFTLLHKEQADVQKFWKCNQCCRMFRMMAALKRHVRSQHLFPDTAKSIIAGFALSQLGDDGKPKKRGPGRPKGSFKKKGRGGRKKKDVKSNSKGKADKPPREKRLNIKWMPTCGKCAAVYDTTQELDNHIGLHTEDENGRILCTECKEYCEENDLREHMKKLHKRVVNPFRCVLCEFSSNRRHDVKKHMYCHEGFKRFQCDSCGKMMSTPYNLKIHRLRVHATESQKTILCSLCGFKCAERAVLKDHMRHKHDLCMNGHSRSSTSKAQYPLFPCKICDYVGKKEASLKYHMRIHEEDRRFKCNLCNYASKTKNNLILHVRTHKGLGPNKCPQCDFRGATTLIVKEHIMAKHTKEKPLKCPVCNWSTCYNGNLWKHMQMHKIHDGILVAGKPKRATRKGIAYEDKSNRIGKLLPITMDGLGEQEEEGQAKEDQRAARLVEVPITVEGIGTTTIMVVPGMVQSQQVESENMSSVVTFETAQQQCGGNETPTHVVSFKPGEPQQEQESSEASNSIPQEGNSIQPEGSSIQQESNSIQQEGNFELEQIQSVDESGSNEQQEVMISVAGSSDQNIQQSISSIITSMAASAAGTQPSLVGSTLIETQLSASEVASQFEDGTIIEITQIPTSGDGTAIIPEGAVVERISPGMSASDIIMKAANMVASGQLPSSISSMNQYTIPIAISKYEEEACGNTLPFLAHVATTQENLPEAEQIQIGEEMETSVVTSEAADGSQVEIVEQLVSTMLPDGSNVMQIMQQPTQEQDE